MLELQWLLPDQPFPPIESALAHPNGLLAASTQLSGDKVLQAYKQGIFPWFSEGQPVLWWSPDPRMVLFLSEFKITRSFAKTIRKINQQALWRISTDHCFERVMRECAKPRNGQDGTWIDENIIAAYCELHERGFAHSVEVWEGPALIGGLYGVCIGRMFYGESMFARKSEASKIALASLVQWLAKADFSVIDCQQNTQHLDSLGAREIERHQFKDLITELTACQPFDWPAQNLDIVQA